MKFTEIAEKAAKTGGEFTFRKSDGELPAGHSYVFIQGALYVCDLGSVCPAVFSHWMLANDTWEFIDGTKR